MSSAMREHGQARVVVVLDNLGKGAAGACVQNLNVDDGLAGNRRAHLAMYNPPHFTISDTDWSHDFIRRNPFAAIASVIDGVCALCLCACRARSCSLLRWARCISIWREAIRLPVSLKVRRSRSASWARTLMSRPDWYETPIRCRPGTTWRSKVPGACSVLAEDDAEPI